MHLERQRLDTFAHLFDGLTERPKERFRQSRVRVPLESGAETHV